MNLVKMMKQVAKLQVPRLRDCEEPEENRKKEVEKKNPSIAKRLHARLPPQEQESISWYFRDQDRFSQHHSYDLRTDLHFRSSAAPRRPWSHRTLVQFHRKQEAWHCRTAERMADRIRARKRREEALGEEGSSGCIRTRQHRVAGGRHRGDTGSVDGQCWPRWMDLRAVYSNRR